MRSKPYNGYPAALGTAKAIATEHLPPMEGRDWSKEMAAVSRLRDHDSFMRIYDHFMPRVRLYLRGLGTGEEAADDLAQEALFRLWQRADLYDPARSGLCTWLFRIARNMHIDRFRREPGWVRLQDDWDSLAQEDDNPGYSATESYAEGVHLKRCIDALSAVQARLVRMSYFEAKSHQQIARELDMPLGTVKSHLRRAFLRLQGDLKGDA